MSPPWSPKKMKTNPYWVGFFKGLKPEPVLQLDEWADNYRYLSQRSSAEAGKWRTNRTPYLREIMRELSTDSPTKEIVFMKGAQIGGSECGLNWLGYIIDHAPGPTMAVQPTVELAKRFSKQRIDSLIEESPRLREKVKPTKDKEAGNNMLTKNFAGGILLITGANSAVGLRSMPARFIFLDEVDAYPQNVDDEGNPISLAKARSRTYKNKRKLFQVSTPTIQGRSNIENAYDKSDRRKYYVPCPHCQFKQPLTWKQMRWENDDPTTTKYICVNCEKEIEERHKTRMLALGEWVAENPEPSKVAGFHLSSLYSPLGWYSWSDAVEDFIKAKGKPDELRTFVNTVLGETWIEKGDAPDWRRLYERRENYKTNTIAQRAALLTAGVDVQKDRLEMQIVAWAKGKESWVIDYRVFPGDTADLSPSGPWENIKKVLQETWEREDKAQFAIRLCAIDSGYNTQNVYDFVRKFPANRVIATKGQDSLQMLIGSPNAVDVWANGKRIRRGLKVWSIGASMAKSELYGLLRLDKPTDDELKVAGYPPGFVHFPEFGEEYFKQLTAEQLQRKVIKGFTKFEWVKVYERNEALDTFILCRAAAAVVGIDRFTDNHWQEMQGISTPIETKAAINAAQSGENGQDTRPNVGQSKIVRRKSSFW